MDESTRGVLVGLSSIIAVCGAVVLWVTHTTAPIDFIERRLGFSPDNGDGSLEFILIAVFLMIITAGAFRWASK
jgi:hypothetical protein